jgi:putative ABC transport system permease protein
MFRTIQHSMGRFVAIFAIVALGVGFLTGLLTATPALRTSIDRYLDEQRMADVFVKATMGLTEDDLTILAAWEPIEQIMPAKVTDAVVKTNSSGLLTARIYGLPSLLAGDGAPGLNQPQLLQGRWPQAANECLVEQSDGHLVELPLGAALTITAADNDDLEDIYAITEFEVVGVVGSPVHFAKEREPSSAGNGYLSAILYLDIQCYQLEVYTDFFVRLTGAEQLTAFTDQYQDRVQEVVEQLEQLGEQRSRVRLAQVRQQGRDELQRAKEEYADGRQQAERELADAWWEIEVARQQLVAARRELDDGYRELAAARLTLQQEVATAEAEMAQAEQDLGQALLELQDGEQALAEAIMEVEDGWNSYQQGLDEFLQAEQELADAQAEFDAGEREYRRGVSQLNSARRQLEQAEAELAAARQQLEAGEEQYAAGRAQLDAEAIQFQQLLAPILSGLPYSSADELFQAMEQDATGAVTGAVDTTLAAMREGIAVQITALESQLALLDDAVVSLETLLSAIADGVAELPPGSTREGLEAELFTLRTQRDSVSDGLAVLEASLDELPTDAAQLFGYWQALQRGEAELQAAQAKISLGWEQYQAGQAQLQSGWAEYDAGQAELNEAAAELASARRQLQDAWEELAQGRLELQEALLELEDGEAQVAKARQELDDGWADYQAGVRDLAAARETLVLEVEDAEQSLAEAAEELRQGELDYQDGLRQLAEGEAKYWQAEVDVAEELRDAERAIADAERDLEALELPSWYVLDRNANVSYVSFAMNSAKVEAIATVFPAFFFLVAALVALTTMTRMVEEERTQIGTLKALGYSKRAIRQKYLFYCGLATLSGCLFGLLAGVRLLPAVIWNAFGTVYHLPQLVTLFSWPFALAATLLAVLCTMLATVSACNRALAEKPATLMRPRAPQAGKRVWLERIRFIWSRLSFSHKATARNLIRYKKHFYMTVLGVAGCTALIVTGFGLRDSLGSITNTQFNQIFRYDLTIEMEDDGAIGPTLQDWLADETHVTGFAAVGAEIGQMSVQGKSVSANIYVPQDENELQQMVSLRSRKAKQALPFDQWSVISSERLATELSLRIGDQFILENTDGQTAHFTLTGITENYVGSYLYLGRASYSQAFDRPPTSNLLLVKTTVDDDAALQDKTLRRLLACDGVLRASFIAQTKQSFDNLLGSINLIVVVLILAAGALAMIVLYNLININIAERQRELAALRVLGFHQREVAGYIFRETAILSVIGTLCGLFLGLLLHTFVVRMAESPDLMLGRRIALPSFIWSALITLVFSALVDLMMVGKLRQIEMVDCMKTVD